MSFKDMLVYLVVYFSAKQIEYNSNDLFWYGKISFKKCLSSHVAQDITNQLNWVFIYEPLIQGLVGNSLKGYVVIDYLRVIISTERNSISSQKKWNMGSNIFNFIKLSLRLMGILVQLLSVMRVFVNYVIIIYWNWIKYTYLYLVLKENTTHILYKSPHFCEELVYVINYY